MSNTSVEKINEFALHKHVYTDICDCA